MGYDRRENAQDSFGRWLDYRSEDGMPVPAWCIRNVVCPTCDGNGRYVNPSIDSNGITSDEWAEWDDDDREAYFSGGYDVMCGECRGANVVRRLSSDAPAEIRQDWDDYERAMWELAAEYAAERRMGA